MSDDGKAGDVVQNQHYDEAEEVDGESSMSMTEDSFRSPMKSNKPAPEAMAVHTEEGDDEGDRATAQDGTLMNLHHDEVGVCFARVCFVLPDISTEWEQARCSFSNAQNNVNKDQLPNACISPLPASRSMH